MDRPDGAVEGFLGDLFCKLCIVGEAKQIAIDHLGVVSVNLLHVTAAHRLTSFCVYLYIRETGVSLQGNKNFAILPFLRLYYS